jgi:hypothetical protein
VALWVDPAVHGAECRRFDSYLVKGPDPDDCDLSPAQSVRTGRHLPRGQRNLRAAAPLRIGPLGVDCGYLAVAPAHRPGAHNALMCTVRPTLYSALNLNCRLLAYQGAQVGSAQVRMSPRNGPPGVSSHGMSASSRDAECQAGQPTLAGTRLASVVAS